jgi:monoamine oxidase
MIKKEETILIIGAGLSGLTLAYLLSKKNISTTILEASSRIGGRIQTSAGNLDTPLELGATWFSDLHVNLFALLDELDLQKYPQYTTGKSLFQTSKVDPPQEFYVPETQQKSYRIAGGTQALIDTLQSKATLAKIQLNSSVKSISKTENGLVVETANQQKLQAHKVILCLPPQLVGSAITFSPSLPNQVLGILPTVQTWMAGSIKFVLEYEVPFWRTKGFSGMIFSHTDIVTEMHDHTNFEKNKFGFTGFLHPSTSAYPKEVRKEAVLIQLEKLLGLEATKPVSYNDKVWTDEFVLGENQLVQYPHQNNGHAIFSESYLDDSVFFAGSETATQFGGYMEGAVISANAVCNRIT